MRTLNTKAVLVIDMPKICRECSLKRGLFCGANGRDLYGFYTKGIADWCPLKPMPEKKSHTYDDVDTEYGIVEGWNACIDEILEETE